MALQLSITNESGVTCNFWVIISKIDDPIAKTLTARLSGYVSDVYYSSGTPPVMTRDIVLAGDDYQPDLTFAQVEGAVKRMSDYSTGVPVPTPVVAVADAVVAEEAKPV